MLVDTSMKYNDAAQQLIEADPATLVTVNRDGSAQASLVWLTVVKTVDGDDELITGHLSESQKVHNIRRDPRAKAVFVSTDRSGPFVPYLLVSGTARIEVGGAPELLTETVPRRFRPSTGVPAAGAPGGSLTRLTAATL